MIIDVSIPSNDDLVKMSNSLIGAPLTENLFFKASLMARFDPRICEMLVKKVSDEWQNLDPVELNRLIRSHNWGATSGVVIDTAKMIIRKEGQRDFSAWRAASLYGLKKVPFQDFYIGLYPFSSRQLLNEIRKNKSPFKRWGFFSSELPINKAALRTAGKTSMPKPERLLLLKELLKSKPRITTNNYITYLGGGLSRRTAELDLASLNGVIKIGNTKGAYYRLKAG